MSADTNDGRAVIYATGTVNGKPAVFCVLNGAKFVIPTDVFTMSRLAESGIKVQNEQDMRMRRRA